jgi:TRAP-type transport system periplasmic protein
MKLKIMITMLLVICSIAFGNTKIKFATVAPEGSTWMNVMTEYAAAVKDATNGEVSFKIYAGGVAGDEQIVLRKIRVGQLHSAGFTGVGLGEILPEVRILDSPFLFRSAEEIDHISSTLFDYFAQRFEEKGFVLLGWAEVGFVYVYTDKPIYGLEDMSGVKMWMWEGDPIAEATFNAFDISPIPLSISDVLTSLQTNLIDGIYVSPLACTALQWHTKVKYMLNFPLANSNGAVLLSKKQFDKLTDEQQKILKDLSFEYLGKLTQLSRQDNVKSLELIKQAGIQFTELKDPNEIESFYKLGEKARKALVGKLYDQKLLDQVENSLKEFRSKE